MDWDKLQAEHKQWVQQMYPDQPPNIPAMGIVEESGELLHAVLKMGQEKLWGKEGRYVNLSHDLVDAVGDCVIYVISLCNALNWDAGQFLDCNKWSTPADGIVIELVKRASEVAATPYTSFTLHRYCECLRSCTEVLKVDFDRAVQLTWGKVKRRTRGEPAPTTVCLCGSTRFMQAFYEANMRETLAGRIVLTVGMSSHGDFKPTEEQKIALDKLHFRKIDKSDEALILDVKSIVCEACEKPARLGTPSSDGTMCCGSLWHYENYIGESTRNEISYAESLGKKVRYLSKET